MHSDGASVPRSRLDRHGRTTARTTSRLARALAGLGLLAVLAAGCGDDDAPSAVSSPPKVPTSGPGELPAPSGAPSTGSATPAPTTPPVSETDTAAGAVATTPSTAPVPAAPASTAPAATGTGGSCEVGYEVVSTRPHDPNAFTQGLVVDGDVLQESTGLYGQSTVRTVDPDTGAVLASTPLPAEHFGEGLTLFDGLLYQLTWREGVVHVYDRSLNRVDTRSWPAEGWGLTTDGDELVLSDGSSILSWIDPTTWTASRTLQVTADGQPVPLLNELELVDGAVLANVWKSPLVVVVDPASGQVTGRLDLTALLPDPTTLVDPEDDVLNGVALDPASGHLFVTGKRWPTMYELDVDRSCWPAGSTAGP